DAVAAVHLGRQHELAVGALRMTVDGQRAAREVVGLAALQAGGRLVAGGVRPGVAAVALRDDRRAVAGGGAGVGAARADDVRRGAGVVVGRLDGELLRDRVGAVLHRDAAAADRRRRDLQAATGVTGLDVEVAALRVGRDRELLRERAAVAGG